MQHTMNFESIISFDDMEIERMEIPLRSPARLYSGTFKKGDIAVDDIAYESSLEERTHDTSSISDGSVFSDNDEYDKKVGTTTDSKENQDQCQSQEQDVTEYIDDEFLEEFSDEDIDICTIDGVVEITGVYGEGSKSSNLALIDIK